MTRYLLGGAIAAILAISLSTGAIAGTAAPDRDPLIFVTGRGADEILAIDTRDDNVVTPYAVPDKPGKSPAAAELGRLIGVSETIGEIHLFDIDGGKHLGAVDPGFKISACLRIQFSMAGH